MAVERVVVLREEPERDDEDRGARRAPDAGSGDLQIGQLASKRLWRQKRGTAGPV